MIDQVCYYFSGGSSTLSSRLEMAYVYQVTEASNCSTYPSLLFSVGDPDPEPDADPHVFRPPGSGSLVRGTDPDPSLFSYMC
jgi:hypothetical protein